MCQCFVAYVVRGLLLGQEINLNYFVCFNIMILKNFLRLKPTTTGLLVL